VVTPEQPKESVTSRGRKGKYRLAGEAGDDLTGGFSRFSQNLQSGCCLTAGLSLDRRTGPPAVSALRGWSDRTPFRPAFRVLQNPNSSRWLLHGKAVGRWRKNQNTTVALLCLCKQGIIAPGSPRTAGGSTRRPTLDSSVPSPPRDWHVDETAVPGLLHRLKLCQSALCRTAGGMTIRLRIEPRERTVRCEDQPAEAE
jgi:hypothetical protein